MVRLLVATRNQHKLREIREIFLVPGLEIIGADEIEGLPSVIEDGSTMIANAVKKAVCLAVSSHLWTMADDSGLEVDALGGAPGVYSARYSGPGAGDESNNAKLLAELVSAEDRSARFRCVIALSSPGGRAQAVDGVCEGTIALEPRGAGGFGYDPLFIPAGYLKTFGELPAETKNMVSHRARALQNAFARWRSIFESGSAGDFPTGRATPAASRTGTPPSGR